MARKILVIGSGGREHALAWKAASSPTVEQVFVAPGNAGTLLEPGVTNVDIGVEDIDALVAFAREEDIHLTIVGPEAPLVLGVADRFAEHGLRCFGPNSAAARLEGSKSFTKEFLDRHKIPTAAYESFTDLSAALAYLEGVTCPVVVKADGLAAGKGVVIAATPDEAAMAVREMLEQGQFGEAGRRVVVEQFLEGEEASFIAIVGDGFILPMASSQDHKAAWDGDTGPNTGGMGAYSPAPIVDDAMHDTIMETVMRPTIGGLSAEGIPFTGFLYAGLMIDAAGTPHVLEFNCRFGDPETQPILMRMKSDLVEHCLAAVEGRLGEQEVVWDERMALGVVLAAEGYPGSYRKGDQIEGIREGQSGAKVFHAGTAMDGDRVVVAGGRVLCATALGETVARAQEAAYALAEPIHWPGGWCRRDIGYRAVAREQDSA